MNLIPLLQPQDDEIKESLSLEEIRIALVTLRKRFKEYTPHQIVQALVDYLAQKSFNSQSFPIGRPPLIKYPRLPEPSFLHHRHYPVTPQDRAQKSQEIRLVALLYCESGINYSLAQYFFPEMTTKQYKSDLEMITAQTLNNIEKFFTYEARMQVEQLTRDQKYSIRDKMLNVRDWLGKTNPEQLKTYFMFIERYYLNENIEIQLNQAIDLYRVILQSVKGPQVDVQQVQGNGRGLREEFRIIEEEKKGLTKEEQNSIILLFKQYSSVQKVSDSMCQKYGYHIKWSVHAIRKILMRIYKQALKRLVNANKRILNDRNSLWFGYEDGDVKKLMEYENSLPTKLLLLQFYLLAKVTKLKLMEYVKKVNEFYVKQHRPEIDEPIAEEEEVRIPTLVVEDHPVQTIVIKDEEEYFEHGKMPFKSRKIHKINKGPKDKTKNQKRICREFIVVDSGQEEEVYIFSRDEGFFEKSCAQDDTDVEDEGPKSRREKKNFRPNDLSVGNMNGNRKEKQPLKPLKVLKEKKGVQKMDERPQKKLRVQKEQEKGQRRDGQKEVKKEEKLGLKGGLKRREQNEQKLSTMNKSFQSTISEPTRLSVYRAQRQEGEIPESLKALIKRKLAQKEDEQRKR